MNAPSATANFLLGSFPTGNHCGRLTSPVAFKITAHMVRPETVHQGRMKRRLHHDELACTLTLRLRRTVSMTQSARFVWRSSQSECRWHGWSVFVDFIVPALRLGLSTIPGGAPCISMMVLVISDMLAMFTAGYMVCRTSAFGSYGHLI